MFYIRKNSEYSINPFMWDDNTLLTSLIVSDVIEITGINFRLLILFRID